MTFSMEKVASTVACENFPSLSQNFYQSKYPVYEEHRCENDNPFIEISTDVLKPVPEPRDKDHPKAQQKLG